MAGLSVSLQAPWTSDTAVASTLRLGDANSGFQAGVINGSVSAEIHHHHGPARPESPPSPSAVIPFGRDPHFINRRTILDLLYQKCSQPGSWTALVGLGGVGKSQLAIEYAYRICEHSPETWVFWVHASNAARFEQSFRDIANCARIPGRHDSQAPIFELVRDWLNQRRRRWLLILDNVDEASFLVNVESGSARPYGSSRALKEYIPHSVNGCVLITSRTRSAALKLTEEDSVIQVNRMDKSDATTLLQKKLENVQNRLETRYPDNDIAELVTALELMPLAIVQAAAYISELAPRCTVRKYLEQFQQSDSERESLLNYEGGQLRRDKEAKNSIIITWQISFDQIRETRSSAADLLSLMSFFDSQGIPESLLRRPSGEAQCASGLINYVNSECDRDEEASSYQCSQNKEFEKDVLVLRNFSFISVDSEGTTFEMDSLVQLATRTWLTANGQLERWKQQFIRNLHAEVPLRDDYEHLETWKRLFPHARSAAVHPPQAEESLREWSTILHWAGSHALKIGNAVDAQKLSEKALKIRTKILGPEHQATLASKSLVGLVYKFWGLWSLAEEQFVEVMRTKNAKLGADHPDTLITMSILASTYSDQGQYKAAEELLRQVMEKRRTRLGADDPDTLITMGNLALTYSDQGQYKAAEELQIQVMEKLRARLGEDNINTLITMSNLASTYSDQGQYKAAEELLIQVRGKCRARLGEDHHGTLIAMSNLALNYFYQGQYKEAEELLIQALGKCRARLGADNIYTLTVMKNLANCYSDQGRYKEEEELWRQALETCKARLGADVEAICLMKGDVWRI